MGDINQLVVKSRTGDPSMSLGPAYVVSINKGEGTVLFVYEKNCAPTNCLVGRVPQHLRGQLSIGAEVLVQTGFDGRDYVLGVLSSDSSAMSVISKSIEIVDGESPSIRVLDDCEQVLFEYFPEEKKGRLSTKGSLDLISEDGDINLKSSRDVNLLASRVNLKSLQGINLKVLGSLDKIQSGVSLLHNKLSFQSERLDLASKYQSSSTETLQVKATEISSQAKIRRDNYETVERISDTVVNKTRHLMQFATGAVEQNFERLSTKVKKSFNVTSERTSIVSEKEVRVDGEDILLG